MLDCLKYDETPKKEDQLRAYLGVSRVKVKEGLLIVQPYHPKLFQQGEFAGPELLMRLHRKEIQVKDLETLWQTAEEDAGKQKKNLRDLKYFKGFPSFKEIPKDATHWQQTHIVVRC